MNLDPERQMELIFREYLDVVHRALQRTYGTPSMMRQLIEEDPHVLEKIFPPETVKQMQEIHDRWIDAYCRTVLKQMPEASQHLLEESGRRAFAKTFEQLSAS
jgi:hypothetical protein